MEAVIREVALGGGPICPMSWEFSPNPPALVSVMANPSAIFNSSTATTNKGAKFETTATSKHLGTCHVHTSDMEDKNETYNKSSIKHVCWLVFF